MYMQYCTVPYCTVVYSMSKSYYNLNLSMVKTRTGRDTRAQGGHSPGHGGSARGSARGSAQGPAGGEGGGAGKKKTASSSGKRTAAVGRKAAAKQKCGRVHEIGVRCAGCATAGVTDWAAYEKRMRKLGRSYVRRSTGGKVPRKQPVAEKT